MDINFGEKMKKMIGEIIEIKIKQKKLLISKN